MPSFYSVLQYVPRALADERINFGVVCFDDTMVRTRVLSNWSRVERFSQGDVHFLKDFASRIQQATRQLDVAGAPPIPAEWARGDLEQMARNWSNSIQLTEPRASLLRVGELADSIYADFVDEPTRHVTDARGRRDAKQDLRAKLREALETRLINPADVRALTKRSRLDGKAEKHPFDAILGNGTPVVVAHALSFEVDATLPSEDLLRSLAFRIEDVRKLQPDLPFGIYALPPTVRPEAEQAQERFARAQTILSSVDAQVVRETEFGGWIAPFVESAVAHVA